jgi:pimeloyl-ACP methyl ester carboxylesterase
MRHRWQHGWQATSMAAFVALLAGCGTSPPPASGAASLGATTGPAPTAAASAAALSTPVIVPTRLAETLTLADGREIKARCVGEGSPTILLEVGGSGDMSEWQPQFVNSLGAETTTCLYSRAGGRGSSEPKKRPVSMAGVTADAYEVLALAHAKAGVDGPYVFVGWSLGGSVALADALARPDQTAGVAILDSDFPADGLALCKASGRPAAECQADYEGDIDARFMEAQVAHAVHPLDLPAILVTAMDYPDCAESPGATLSAEISGVIVVAPSCAGLATAIADKQVADWRAALPEVVQTRVDADHDGLVRAAGRHIAELILGLVAEARASG